MVVLTDPRVSGYLDAEARFCEVRRGRSDTGAGSLPCLLSVPALNAEMSPVSVCKQLNYSAAHPKAEVMDRQCDLGVKHGR